VETQCTICTLKGRAPRRDAPFFGTTKQLLDIPLSAKRAYDPLGAPIVSIGTQDSTPKPSLFQVPTLLGINVPTKSRTLLGSLNLDDDESRQMLATQGTVNALLKRRAADFLGLGELLQAVKFCGDLNQGGGDSSLLSFE